MCAARTGTSGSRRSWAWMMPGPRTSYAPGPSERVALSARLRLEHAVLAGLQEVVADGRDEDHQQEARHVVDPDLRAEHLARGLLALPKVPQRHERRDEEQEHAREYREHGHHRVVAELFRGPTGLPELSQFLVDE